MKFQTTPHIVFPGIELPPRAMIGMKESYEVVGEVETDRDLLGNLIVLQPSWMSLTGDEVYRITLTASGDGIHKALLDDLYVGRRLRFYGGDWWNALILPGQTTTERPLRREPVPGSVSGLSTRDLKGPRIPVAVNGRIPSIPAPVDYPITVFYRPDFDIQVVARDRGGHDRFGRSRSYGITLEEVAVQS